MSIESFKVQVAQDVLDDLRERLGRTRLPDAVVDVGWAYGTELSYLEELLRYYREQFDWRLQERRINQLSHFRASVDGVGLHFVHHRAEREQALPLLLTHGFPDSFLRMEKLIPMLVDPARHGGDPADAFHVVVPSLPGFGFSERATTSGMTPRKVASLFARLMIDELGYERFGAHGGDWGSVITEQLAIQVPSSLAGIHLTDVPFVRLLQRPPPNLSDAEQRYLARAREWQAREGAYNALQATKPQTLAYGLNDSPAGLTAWLIEKFRSWSDCEGALETRFSKDELLTHVTLYWVTQTIGSACRLYYESGQDREPLPARIEVPTAIAQFPKDLVVAPREYAERWYDLQRWTTMPRGGHFAALEEPALLAADLRAFFRPLRGS